MNPDQLIRALATQYRASFDLGVDGHGDIFVRMIGFVTVTGTGETLAEALAEVASKAATIAGKVRVA